MENSINSNIFDFQYFLGGKVKVNNLHESAIKYGGATKYNDNIYSNIKTNEFIKINENINTISIFVPSTININQEIDNTHYIKKVINIIKEQYDISNLKFYRTVGSWYDTDNEDVIVENITIITIELNKISIPDIKYFINIANYLKEEMKQQAISININDSLCLV